MESFTSGKCLLKCQVSKERFFDLIYIYATHICSIRRILTRFRHTKEGERISVIFVPYFFTFSTSERQGKNLHSTLSRNEQENVCLLKL